MASNLFTPVLNDRTRAPHFFNGRLLTGEAMTDEQRANHVARELLAQAVGEGVAYGLEVSPATLVTTLDRPVVTVKSGVAINRRGEVLLLTSDTDVQLVRPAETPVSPTKIFRACTPVSTGTYVADAGVYLLTISSIRAGNGLAKVSGLGDAPAGCNIKYIVDAVEFRLLELPLSEATLSDTNRLRNRVAYECFGVGDLGDFITDPYAAAEAQTPLDELREDEELTDCDVPLAVLYWTASGGVVFVDLWSVRRRIAKTSTASPFALDDVRLANAEAMRDQFLAHLDAVRATAGALTTLRARDHFRWLPPAAYVPLASSGGASGFTVDAFFDDKTWNRHVTWPHPIYMEGGMVETLLRDSAKYPPVDLEDDEMVWLYSVRQNHRALHTGSSVQPYVVFANANMPFYGEPRFDRAHWNYSNFI